jgi:hypothetical protein
LHAGISLDRFCIGGLFYFGFLKVAAIGDPPGTF